MAAMPAQFRPLPLLGNPHVQTVLGSLWEGAALRYPVRRATVHLPDGDRLVLHESVPEGWRPGDPVALLVHGMGGCHESGYMRRVAGLLFEQGVCAVRLDLRGAGCGLPLARRPYNGGCSDDVRAALAELHARARGSPLWAMGFSLGGNIVLKLAGEAAQNAVPGLARVAAMAPPIDLMRCSDLISRPRNRPYELYFLRCLLSQVRARWQHFPDLPKVHFPRNLTLRGFDDLYTAPQAGYADARDYYRRASALPLIPEIPVPALLLTARDDPFVAPEPFTELRPPRHVAVHVTPGGGHLGFLGRDGAGGVRWAERFVVEWLLAGNA